MSEKKTETLSENLKRKLRNLADKYEIITFCDEDPSQFLRWYETKPENYADIESAAFITAMLSFGNRKQFIPKIRSILEISKNKTLSQWLITEAYKTEFPSGSKKFYRFYSYDDMQTFFGELSLILKKWGSLGEGVKQCVEIIGMSGDRPLYDVLSEVFAALFSNSAIVPKGKNSANKRIHMFMRWMVRQNSPVDLGIWKWYPQSALIMPLDVHVMEESIKLGLLPENAKATRKTAVLLTEKLNEVFEGDPVRGDYALFGVGIDS